MILNIFINLQKYIYKSTKNYYKVFLLSYNDLKYIYKSTKYIYKSTKSYYKVFLLSYNDLKYIYKSTKIYL